MGAGEKLPPSFDGALLRRLEAAALVLAAVAAAGQLCGLLVVLGHTVTTLWSVGGTLLAASVVLRLVSRRVARPGGARPLPWAVKLLRGSSIVAVAVICSLSALADLSAAYRVLDPAGPTGCRAAVREHSFLFSGSGTVYATGFGGIAYRAGTWTTDDGYEPVAHGDYTLRWSGGAGLLELSGGIDPVWPALHSIPCS